MAKRKLTVSSYDIVLPRRVKEIVEYRFKHPNKTQREMAKDLQLSETRISAVLNNKKVREAFPLLARRTITSYIPKAVGAYEKLIDQNENLKVKLEAARDVLASEKVLESQPTVQINNFQGLSTDELASFINTNMPKHTDIVDAELSGPTDQLPSPK